MRTALTTRLASYGTIAFTLGIIIMAAERMQIARCQQADDSGLLRKLSRIYDDRQEQFNPIWIRYKIERVVSAAGQAQTTKKKINTRTKEVYQAEFARKGAKRRIWYKREDGQENFVLFNGDVQITPSGRPNEYMITKKPTNQTPVPLPLEMTGEGHLSRVIKLWIAGELKLKKVSAVKQRGADGNELLVLELTSMNNWRDKYWILPDREHSVRRFEMYTDKGRLLGRGEVLAYDEKQDIVYPIRGRCETFQSDGSLGSSEEFAIEAMKLEASQVPDDLFRFAFPRDASIWDQDLKTPVRRTEVAQSHLDEVVQHIEPRSVWRSWLLFSGIVFALAATGFGLVLWRKKWRTIR